MIRKHTIKDKLQLLDKNILKKWFLEKILKVQWVKYWIKWLMDLWYISSIKKWEIYLNNKSSKLKNPYVIWASYIWSNDYLFWWPDMFNKYWFTTQISNVFTIYNLEYSKEIEIVWIRFQFKKVKKEFLFWKQTKMIDWLNINFMSKERCFLEYIRTYIKYDNNFFNDIFKVLDLKNLDKYLKRYPLQNVVKKINQIKNNI